ncbi:MAG: phosphatase PAP2 family protein [Opitutae bacterium]
MQLFPRFTRPILVGLLLALGGRLTAGYLPAGQPDTIALLAPPPAASSGEDKADLAMTYAVYSSATPEESARAKAQNKLTIFHYAPVIGTWFVAGKFPRTEALFQKVEAEAKATTDQAKAYWKRPRPYHIDPQRFAHSTEHEDPTHYSYPSGHSTRGTVFTLLLAELFPEKREALLALGRETGWLRIQGGVHYPTDVYAGRVLGQELARDFLRSPEFQADLAAVRAELAAAAK